MPLTDDDLDRLADKIELSVTRSINAAMDKHVHDIHGPCERSCETRMVKMEERQGSMDAKLHWGMGLLAGLTLLWEFLKKKLGA